MNIAPCLRLSAPRIVPFQAFAAKRFISSSQSKSSSQVTPISATDSVGILNAQRERRPNSPHFTIYQPQVSLTFQELLLFILILLTETKPVLTIQITWLASIANRVTGSALSVALYAGSITYLLHGMYPILESSNLVQLVHDLPVWAKGSAKLLFAVPFTFHTFNGIRHLAWDVGYGELTFLLFRICIYMGYGGPSTAGRGKDNQSKGEHKLILQVFPLKVSTLAVTVSLP